MKYERLDYNFEDQHSGSVLRWVFFAAVLWGLAFGLAYWVLAAESPPDCPELCANWGIEGQATDVYTCCCRNRVAVPCLAPSPTPVRS